MAFVCIDYKQHVLEEYEENILTRTFYHSRGWEDIHKVTKYAPLMT